MDAKTDPYDATETQLEKLESPGTPPTSSDEDDPFYWFTPEEGRKIKHKIDRRLVLVLGAMYCVSLMDRTNLSNAAIAGMRNELFMVGNNRYVSWFFIFFKGLSNKNDSDRERELLLCWEYSDDWREKKNNEKKNNEKKKRKRKRTQKKRITDDVKTTIVHRHLGVLHHIHHFPTRGDSLDSQNWTENFLVEYLFGVGVGDDWDGIDS